MKFLKTTSFAFGFAARAAAAPVMAQSGLNHILRKGVLKAGAAPDRTLISVRDTEINADVGNFPLIPDDKEAISTVGTA